jgi:hypothetical protein
MQKNAVLASLFILVASIGHAADYELVINNGRVMDSETSFEGIRHLGIEDGTIVRISENPLAGRETIDPAQPTAPLTWAQRPACR